MIASDLETGSNSSNIAAGDTGSPTAWNSVVKGTTGAIIYDNAHVAHGSLAAKISQGVTLGQSYLDWSTAFGTQTDHYGRFYFYLGTAPASLNQTLDMVQWLNGGTSAAQIRINTSGKMIAANGAGTATTAGTTTIAVSTLYRVEWHVVHNASTGSVQLKLFTDDSTTATETITLSSTNTQAQATEIRIGCPINSMTNFSVWLDNIIENGTAFPGPFPVNTVAPAVTGSTPVGSVLTCDGGTWGGTFTLTYQWTSDGSNIGGATSSTYTTVSADASHGIGCTVTATGQQATNESASQASSNAITPTGGSLVTDSRRVIRNSLLRR